MKLFAKTVLFAVTLFGFNHQTFANPACILNLQWQGSLDASVAGYAIYYTADDSFTTNRLDVGSATSASVNNLIAASNYSFYVVAYDSDHNESDPSNLFLYKASAISAVELSQLSDGTMALSFHVAPGAACHVEYTDILSPPSWDLLTTSLADSNGLVTISDSISSAASRYYRAVIP